MVFSEEALAELKSVLDSVNDDELNMAADIISKGTKIFAVGCGRTGYMMRAFVMRLMHMGLEVYFIGDTETPAATEGDLLIIGSGSGETTSLKAIADKGKLLGMKLLVFTGNRNSYIGEKADHTVLISTNTPKKDINGDIIPESEDILRQKSIFPMGSVSEISLLIVSDILINILIQKMNINIGDMICRHANLE